MGTRGFVVYRHRGRYFARYNHWDSYPSGLGLTVLQGIPRPDATAEDFEKWLRVTREWLDSILDRLPKELEDGNGEEVEVDQLTVTSTQPTNDLFIEWVYELDLDHLVFHVDCQ